MSCEAPAKPALSSAWSRSTTPMRPMVINQFIGPPARIRAKDEGETIAIRGQKGCVGNLMNDDMAIDGSGIGPRPKKSSKDHIKENVKRMRQIQRASHQKSAEQENRAPKPVKALWKSEKFANVPSKVAEAMEAGNMTPRPASREFLRAHSRSGPSRPGSRSCSPVPRLVSSASSEKLNVPLASDAKSIQMARNNFDFIKINGMNARYYGMRRSPSETALDEVKHKKEEDYKAYKRGEVPQYLRDRRKQWAKDAEERAASAPDPDCPPGHRLMPENERRETLQILKTKHQELVRALQDIPLTSDTLRTRNKRHETEQKLEEVEEAMRIFNRQKVFIKVDQ